MQQQKLCSRSISRRSIELKNVQGCRAQWLKHMELGYSSGSSSAKADSAAVLLAAASVLRQRCACLLTVRQVAPAPWCASQRSLPLRCRQLVCATPYHAPPVVAPTTEQVARHHHVQGRLPGTLGMVYGAQAAPQLQCREDAAVGGACSSAVGAAQPAGGADLQ